MTCPRHGPEGGVQARNALLRMNKEIVVALLVIACLTGAAAGEPLVWADIPLRSVSQVRAGFAGGGGGAAVQAIEWARGDPLRVLVGTGTKRARLPSRSARMSKVSSLVIVSPGWAPVMLNTAKR